MIDFDDAFEKLNDSGTTAPDSKAADAEAPKDGVTVLEFKQDNVPHEEAPHAASEPASEAPVSNAQAAAPSNPETTEKAPETPENAAQSEATDESLKADLPGDLAEIVVPADAEPEKESVPSQASAPARRTAPARTVVLRSDEDGEISDELMRRNEADLDDDEKEIITYRKLVTARRTGRVLWGTVVGTERSSALNQVLLSVMFNGVTVMIPDSEFFEPNYKFGGDYDNLTNATDRRAVRERHARYYLGATVPFVLKGINRDQKDSGVTVITAVGSRKEAMKKIRDDWFISGAKHHTVQEGDIVEAHVVKVRPDMITVECLGVETRIYALFISSNIVENCENFVKVGDKMNVRIHKIYINDIKDKDGNVVDKDVYLNVTGRIYKVPAAIYSMSERSTYRGTVTMINRERKHCIVMLDNGVRAIVPDSQVEGNLHLTIGDHVEVRVMKIYDSSVFGRAVKLF